MLRLRKLKFKRKGFLLLEVVVSIVLITIGLFLVVRVYDSAKKSIKRSTDTFNQAVLLENKIFEINIVENIADIKKQGVFSSYPQYSWKIDYRDLDVLSLQIVELSILDNKYKDDFGYKLVSYVKRAEEITE